MLRKYMDNNKRIGNFGVSYLDDKLRGILQGDLILIGARSGAGKTSIANQIALSNRDIGTKISLFSLENFEGDCFLEKAYYKYMQLASDYKLNLRDFASGNFDINNSLLITAENHAKKAFEGINIINRRRNYDIESLKNDIIKEVENNESKLIILDHLDYVSKYSKESDNDHISELMRTIRDVQDSFKVAVIAISHLRKGYQSKEQPVIPSMDEFIGSGTKVKEATCVIMLAPDDEGNMELKDYSKRSTWCCIRKLRMGGIDNKAAKLFFDTKTGTYSNNYSIYKVNYSGTKTEFLNTGAE